MPDVYSDQVLLDSMESNGISKSVVWPMRQTGDYSWANKYVLESSKRHPNKLIPVVRLNPWLESSATELENAILAGAKGLKLHPGDEGFEPDDKVVHPLLEIAEKMCIPVAIHTGGSYSSPVLVGELSDRFPGVRIIMLHLGQYQESTFVAKKCDNVYLETSQCLYLTRVLKQIVHKVGANRVIWGSDTPYHFQEIEKRKMELSGLNEADRTLVFGENVQRLMTGS